MKHTNICICLLAIVSMNSYAKTSLRSSDMTRLAAVATTEFSSEKYLAEAAPTFDIQKNKLLSKSFPLDKNDKVVLSNIFGGISIKIWNKNEIRVDVAINAFGNSDQEASQLLENVAITAIKEGDQASFKTSIAETNVKRRNRNGNQIKVFYTVYMPANNSLTAMQQYGNISMPNFSGATSLKVQYGDLTAGDLSNTNNYISVQYGKAMIGNINAAKIKQQYGGGLTISAVNTLELNAQYSKVSIGSVTGNATINQQYGSGLNISSAKNLILKSQYCDVKLGQAAGNITASLGYSGLNVENVTNDCKKLDVSASYADVSLAFATNFNGDFNLGTDYGSFNYGTNITSQKADPSSSGNEKRYSGKIGNGGNANIAVKVNYGSVKFN
ncbi:dimeric dUTPase (all-alpha-NTP-PPase superfamily) [Pedobacter sp. UYEF25]